MSKWQTVHNRRVFFAHNKDSSFVYVIIAYLGHFDLTNNLKI